MRALVATSLAIGLAALCGSISSLSARSEAPVRVEFQTPPPVKSGTEATTVITFRALADLDRLEVSAAAYRGLDLISEPKAASFSTVKKGEGRQLSVTVRLTDPKVGTLAIFFTAQRGAKRESGTTGIAFGGASN
jgi:hypothetical protein